MKKLIFAILTYLIPFIIGVFFIQLKPNNVSQSHEDIELFNLTQTELFYVILKNNITVAGINILGFVLFGTLSFLNTSYNGFLLGNFVKIIYDSLGSEVLYKHFLPHSSEIIAIIYSCYIGYELSSKFFGNFFWDKKFELSKKDYLNIILCFLLIIISAFIEAFISISI